MPALQPSAWPGTGANTLRYRDGWNRRGQRQFVIGRENWLFCDTVAGANASAGLYSLIETAEANGIEPCGYLRSVSPSFRRRHRSTRLKRCCPCRMTAQTRLGYLEPDGAAGKVAVSSADTPTTSRLSSMAAAADLATRWLDQAATEHGARDNKQWSNHSLHSRLIPPQSEPPLTPPVVLEEP